MADPPGSVGWPVLGDQSLDFNNHAVDFVNGLIQRYKSRVFAGRLLNKPTIFVCSNRGVQQVLQDETNAFNQGYKAMMEQTYDNNILFHDDEEAIVMREKLWTLFSPDALQSYQETIQSITELHVAKINPRRPLVVYQFFRKVVTEITLTLFLGLDFSSQPEEAARVVRHSMRHWKGLKSVPVKVKLPGGCYESCFCKAMMAKKELLAVIRNQRGKAPNTFVRRLQEMASEEEEDFIDNHLLLFSSAIVPKALGSILTTFAIEMGRPKMVPRQAELLSNHDLMQNVFREVQRICPPIIGGRRLAKKDVVVDGYKVPAGYGVVYMTQAAQRDPQVFSSPDAFCPDRWKDTKALSDANLFVFGQGARGCLAEQLTKDIMQTVARELLSRFHWELPGGQDLTLKYMPVVRPRHSIHVTLTPLATPRPDPDMLSLSTDPSSSDFYTSDTSPESEGASFV